MLTPSEIWPMIAGSAVVVYGAGHFIGSIITKISNGRHVTKEVCDAVHRDNSKHLARIDKNLDRIWNKLNGQPIESSDE